MTATADPTQPPPEPPIVAPTVIAAAPQVVEALANAVDRAQTILANADETVVTPTECARVATTLSQLSYNARWFCSQQVEVLLREAEHLTGPLEVHNRNVAQRLADQDQAQARARSVRNRKALLVLFAFAFVVVVVLVVAVAVHLQWLE